MWALGRGVCSVASAELTIHSGWGDLMHAVAGQPATDKCLSLACRVLSKGLHALCNLHKLRYPNVDLAVFPLLAFFKKNLTLKPV